MPREFNEKAILCWMEFECLPVLCEFWEWFTSQLTAIVPLQLRVQHQTQGDLSVGSSRAFSACPLPVLCLAKHLLLTLPELQPLSSQSFKTAVLRLDSSSLVQGRGQLEDLPRLLSFSQASQFCSAYCPTA